ncbi:MAG: hemolysin family protein [Lachnospiraceae bacterium]|nr:hemolysin family protein [Lachnospiraceae bacterium]
MDTHSIIQVGILLLLLLLSAFFSSAETALTTVNRMRIRALIEEHDKKAIRLQEILDQYSKMLSTILIGNNIVNISASSIATTLAIYLWGSLAVGLVTGLLTILILIFGEIVPKTWASVNSEKLALGYSGIIYILMKILTPAIKVIDSVAAILYQLLHIDLSSREDAITESDLKTIVDVSHEGGIIESEEREMIYNVFDFGDSLAKDIMIPRIDMICIDVDASYDELFQVFKDSMYTRIPVFEGESSNLIGLVNVKDIFLVTDHEQFHIKDYMREAYYTYEFKKTADLLVEMRTSSSNVAFVLDEYGSAVGLITLEDLLEEIVGEIRDEYDTDEQESIKKINEREYLIEGGMKLDDINDALGTHFSSEDYDSIGGIIIELLDRLPEDGEQVTTEDHITLTVEEINQNRIESVRLQLPNEVIMSEPVSDE